VLIIIITAVEGSRLSWLPSRLSSIRSLGEQYVLIKSSYGIPNRVQKFSPVHHTVPDTPLCSSLHSQVKHKIKKKALFCETTGAIKTKMLSANLTKSV